ncbi:MAG TPA: hypothetical protein VFA54_03195 [Bryobacterales bacterium]|jgi:hypothetical protein|nr:hypothetical protein [Bryobacterales bacterium]
MKCAPVIVALPGELDELINVLGSFVGRKFKTKAPSSVVTTASSSAGGSEEGDCARTIAV